MLEQGRGGPKDAARAVPLYTEACERENAEACFNLGELHQFGLSGVAQDRVKAVALFKKACAIGLPPACENLEKLGER
jgi:TPR repeat protein